jgi:acid phosphatase
MPVDRRILLLLVAVMSACAGGASPSTRATPTAAPVPSQTAAPGTVFVILMENRAYGEVVVDPVIARLAKRFAIATNYYAITHPSLPNYLALTSGSTWGITDDGYHPLPPVDLGHQLTSAGVSWRAYIEALKSSCLAAAGGYAVNHNPFAYYGGACPANVVPFTQLAPDLAENTPRFVWITPDVCHDGHSCSLPAASAWLETVVTQIVASPGWLRNGVLFVTWDEDDHSAANHVATLVIAPNLARHETSTTYNHFSLLATIEDRLGVTRLGLAARSSAITDVFAET